MIDLFVSLAILGLIVVAIVVPIALSLYGMYLAVKENILLGLLAFFVHPLPFILGVMAVFGRKDLAHKIAVWLKMKK